jgi:hypothetical protein
MQLRTNPSPKKSLDVIQRWASQAGNFLGFGRIGRADIVSKHKARHLYLRASSSTVDGEKPYLDVDPAIPNLEGLFGLVRCALAWRLEVLGTLGRGWS